MKQWHAASLVLAATLGAMSVSASAQTPRLEGTDSDQPTEADTQQREKAAGIAPQSQQQKALGQDVQSLYNSLMHNSPSGNNAPPKQ